MTLGEELQIAQAILMAVVAIYLFSVQKAAGAGFFLARREDKLRAVELRQETFELQMVGRVKDLERMVDKRFDDAGRHMSDLSDILQKLIANDAVIDATHRRSEIDRGELWGEIRRVSDRVDGRK